ncbi:uncharacterized protein SPPG_09269 [Spizellomyces punctatus DAOM BR117]|uniref:Ras-GEF domain-containing protein n=1 Tax=Spizellomyces punctatus (strain DAOM BR117) TaxID=645134 RepID=A0A0L0HFQ9_SPIPD|nr:uncharacterized protein SPPG_09269 [Spizellomyces punctatus DAOM BR117]KNC99937.1 hypothetical protein SPPG_09269 [Spizellomyces punctatus DAOM BR117]|eukprot:XP_016607977.1 hypothetical protein SPPG_09269 [Spizellomyces punctatus DAOM BR117]
MGRESAAQSFVKRAFSGKKGGPDKSGGPQASEKPSLMFAAGPQEADVLTEFLELQKGVGYFAQPASSVVPILNGHEEVFVKVDLLGVHISENESKGSLIVEFPIEEIIKYSHNRGKQTFCFSHMDADGLLREFKFRSEKYFEIFEAMGRAIAIIIKIKNKRLNEHKDPNRGAEKQEASLSSLLEADEGTNEDAAKGQYETWAGRRRLSHRPGIDTTIGRGSRRTSKSLDQLTNQDSDQDSGGEASVAQKAVLAKLYIESRYHSRGESGAADAAPTEPAAEQRKWKNQVRYDYASISRTKAKSDPSLLDDEPSSRRASVASQKPDIVVRDSVASIRSLQSLASHSKTSSEPLLSLATKKQGRSSVMALFGSKVDTSGGRQRAETEPVGETYGDSNHRPSVNDIPVEANGKPEKYGSLTGFTLKKMASKVSVKKKKQQSAVSPAVKDSGTTSHESLNESLPAVVKSLDTSGKEVLIKNLRQHGYEITAGTVDALVEALIDQPEPDLSYLNTFLLTFRHFISADQFVIKLTEHYQKQMDRIQSMENSQVPSNIMNRIVSLVKRWVGEYCYDFVEPETMAALNKFLELVKASEHSSYAKQIQSLVQHELENLDSKQQESSSPDSAGDGQKPDDLKVLLRDFDLLSQSSKKIAQQLTLVDSKMFRAIRPEEFAVLLWGGGAKDWRAQRLQAYIDRFNRVGYWVGTVVLSFPEHRKRSEALETFIKIANRCMELQNYNTAMAILSGLNTGPVSRLKKTFAGLSSRTTSAYQDLESRLSYRGNYKTYRELEHMSKPPLLPFFGLIIKDLTFLNDGNQKVLSNGLINFEKQRMIYNVINAIREYQRYKFSFNQDEDVLIPSTSPSQLPITLHSYCTHPPCLTEEQLMTLSKILEPSDRDRERQKSITGSISKGSGKAFTGSASRSPSSDALMDVIQGTHAKQAKLLAGSVNPAPTDFVGTPMPQSSPLRSGDPFAAFQSPLKHEKSSDDLTSTSDHEGTDTEVGCQSPPLLRLPSDVRGFLGTMDVPAPLSRTPSPAISESAGHGKRESITERRSSIVAGGTLRRKLSEAGLSAVLGWWRKEEGENGSREGADQGA